MHLTFKKETVYKLCSQILHSKISETELCLYKLVRGETRLYVNIVRNYKRQFY